MTQALKNRTPRNKLPPREAVLPCDQHPGDLLGYRRIEGPAGSWCARVADGQGGNRIVKLGTVADDLVDDNGREIMSYERAADAARKVGQSCVIRARAVPRDTPNGMPQT